MAKLTIAIECIKSGSGYLAAAVVYPTAAIAPLFTYRDSRGATRKSKLHSFLSLPEDRQRNVVQYLKNSSQGWAVVRGGHLSKSEATGLAAARAIEKFRFRQPRLWASLKGHHELEIVHTLKETFPSQYVGEIPCHRYEHRTDDWRISAAYALAKHASL